jgi:hypothetical protein
MPAATGTVDHLEPGARRGRWLGLLVVLALVAVLGAAGQARAYDIAPGSFLAGTLTDDDDNEAYFQQAGGRPTYAGTDFTVATDGSGEPIGQTKSVRVDIPAGLTPNPRALRTCTDAQLAAQACPADTQVGVERIRVRGDVALIGRQTLDVRVPLYNMTRSPDQVARFAFNPAQAPGSQLLAGDLRPVDIIGGVRSDDLGLYFTIPRVPQNPALVRTRLIFWGVPGDPMHDAERTQATTTIPALASIPVLGDVIAGLIAPTGGNQPSSDRTTAFLSMPTSCAGRKTSRVALSSYAGETRTDSYTTPVGVEDCGGVPFAPSIAMGPEQVTRDSPSGLDVGLRVPQSQARTDRATSHVKDVSFVLPPGTTISPSVANGLETCSDAQFAKGTTDQIRCPAASRVGSVSITTPLLDRPLTGDVHLGDPVPGDRYRLFINADGPGFSVRLTGSVRTDPATGQLTTVVENAPQLPFSDFDLHFDDGPRAVLATPQTCEDATSTASLAPWSGTPAATPSATQRVTGCDGFPFAPTFGAAAAPVSGAYTPLAVAFGRNDGDQYLNRIAVALPPGQLARIKGVARCTEAQIAAQACDPASRVGTASVQAGPGSAPYGLSGPVYLTNAYGGGQFGFVVIIRAVAGPYDLGNVVVRQAIAIDPNDAHVTVTSDPLPLIQDGVVLRLRALRLDIDRAGFTRNPTSCGVGRVNASLGAPSGATVQRAADLPFAGCENQGFAPKLRVEFTGKKEMAKGRHPGVKATVTQADGEAGLKSTTVALPKSVALAASNAKGLCETQAALQDRCPAASIVGSASATTSILDRPLSGPVYFVKGVRTTAQGKVVPTLPTLFLKLQGEATIYVRAVTAVSKGRLVTTFPTLPDAPLTNFVLNINGGKHGIIQATASLCSGGNKGGNAQFLAQSGAKPKAFAPKIVTACGKAPGLKVRSARRTGSRLKVSGTVSRRVTGRATVKLVCGTTTVRRTATPRKGRWSTTLRLTKACAKAERARLSVSVASKGAYRAQSLKARNVRLRS